MVSDSGNGVSRLFVCVACKHEGPVSHFWTLPLDGRPVEEQVLCAKCMSVSRNHSQELYFYRLSATLEFLRKKEEKQRERQEEAKMRFLANSLKRKFGVVKREKVWEAQKQERFEAERQKKREREEQTRVAMTMLGFAN